MNLVLEHERACIFHGDSAQLGEVLPENSVDSIVCDPPAGIFMMGRGWDSDRGGQAQWVTWLAELLAPSFRALKPGGSALFWALPRTSDWTMAAVRRAGFEIRDVIHDAIAADSLVESFVDGLAPEQRLAFARMVESQSSPILYHLFGSAMPKSIDMNREYDMHFCTLPGRHCDKNYPKKRRPDDHLCPPHPRREEGRGERSALKPSVEHWIFARKPLKGTYVENHLEYGTGGLNVDACRLGHEEAAEEMNVTAAGHFGKSERVGVMTASPAAAGRWPAHLTLTHAPGCCKVGTEVEQVDAYTSTGAPREPEDPADFRMGAQTAAPGPVVEYAVYACVPECPVAIVEAQRDGASRFYYVAKAPRSEKDAGLAHLTPKTGGEATGRDDDSAGVNNPRAGAGRTGGARNHHPTSKGVALMSWLVRLVTPPGGTVLDMFAGSGTTGVAALAEGFNFIGCELEPDYLPLVVGRVRHALGLPPEPAPEQTAEPGR